MKNKRTRFLLFLTAILLTFTVLFTVACNRTTEEEEDDGGKQEEEKPTMSFDRYMGKINSGMKASEEKMSSMVEYYVNSEYALYTRVENLTVDFEAVYKKNRRNGLYYIRVFDNMNHVERLNMYYNGSDLYVTVRDIHYVIENFGTLMLFDTFMGLVEVIDIEEYVYGSFMQSYFSENTVLAAAFSEKNFTYSKAGENGESITLSGDLTPVIGFLNAQLNALSEGIGDKFDAVTNHYLGFQFSLLTGMNMSELRIEGMRFNINTGVLIETDVDIEGRMTDNSKYFIKGDYSFDTNVTEIASAKSIPTKYAYEPMTPGTGSFDGTATLFNARESEMQLSLDYDVNSKDNSLNKFTLRMYDQNATEGEYTVETKYSNINEIISTYYDGGMNFGSETGNGTLFVNTEGMSAYIGGAIALSALRLPKVYFDGFNLGSAMGLVYSDMLQIVNLLLNPEERTASQQSSRTYSAILNAIASNTKEQEITFTVTEEFVRELRGDNTGLSELLGEALGIDREVMDKYFGNEFFERLKIIVRYNFGTRHLYIELYDLSREIALLDMVKIDYVGIVFPTDLNFLNYSMFEVPEIVTASYKMEFNPYRTESVDIAQFFGAFIGDSSGKNTPYVLKSGQTIYVQGRMSEFYQTDYTGERVTVTTLDMSVYLWEKEKDLKTLWMTIATNPLSRSAEELLIRTCLPIGDYDGQSGDIYYVISREAVSKELDKLTEGTSILSQKSGLAAFIELYNATEDKYKTYSEDGYFCVDIAKMGNSDPINELLGVQNLNGIIMCKIGFDTLDLSGITVSRYTTPYIHEVDDITKNSIYSKGSEWRKSMEVTVGGKRINFLATYEKDTIAIKTGKADYTPTAYIFGKEFSYGFHIATTTGTYKIRSLDIDDNLIVIDPAYEMLPTTISVTYEGAEKGELECEIEGFNDSWITNDGYNLPLLGGVRDGMPTYKFIVGRDSIATIEREVYIAVICRKVLMETTSTGEDDYYVDRTTGRQIPVVASFSGIDPYTVAMEKKLATDGGNEYDFLAKAINEDGTIVRFDNKYGEEEVVDEETGEKSIKELRYEVKGYNWFYLSELDLEWDFSKTEFSWMGETRYAVTTFGSEEGKPIEIAIKVEVLKKEVRAVIIDDYAEGSYTIDYLKKSTYDIPTVSSEIHNVVVVFTDDTRRIVRNGRPSATMSDADYCTRYIYGQLNWEGASAVAGKLEEQGTTGLFGSDKRPTNTTTALFGSEIMQSTQTVSLNVIAPSRYISGRDMISTSLVPSIDENGIFASPIPIQVTGTARFTKISGAPTSTVESFAINPYNMSAVLPDTIWLYVNMTNSDSGLKEWVEYPISWVTTGKTTNDQSGNEIPGEELNIIERNEEGKYALKNKTTEEKRLVVYGRVGVYDEEYDRRIWITMSVLNMRSDIQSYTLTLENGTQFDIDSAMSIDPYLSYTSRLPKYYNALLGSGETTSGETEWYYETATERYPIKRAGKYLSSEYSGNYSEEGYYIFPKEGGQVTLYMNIAAGKVNNYIYLRANVEPRTVYYEEDAVFGNTACIDIFATHTQNGRVTSYSDMSTYVGDASKGYLNVNYYAEESTKLLNRIEELIANDGVGIVGVSVEETRLNNIIYAKKVRWDVERLSAIRDALTKKSDKLNFIGQANSLSGYLDEGNINETKIYVAITISEKTEKVIGLNLINAKGMTQAGVYTITNDVNSDGVINVSVNDEYKSRLSTVGYYRNEEYNRYFRTEGYYQDEFDGFIYFSIDQTFSLSNSSSGLYTNPYNYFSYLFGNYKLVFSGVNLDGVKATISTGKDHETGEEKTIKEFNSSVLGFNDDTISTDSTGLKKSYSFLILEKLSQGSAIERTLIIVEATVARPEGLSRQDDIDALKEDLTERYNENSPFPMPTYIEVRFRKEGADSTYVARYGVDGWESLSVAFNGASLVKEISNQYINIIDGITYEFKFTLPDMEERPNRDKDYYYNVNFRKKNINVSNFDATATNALYNIENGSIVINNSYAFLKKDGEKFALDRTQVPTTLTMRTGNGLFEAGSSDTYKITKWEFGDTEFSESVFANGTVTPGGNFGVVIAQYTFDCYYKNGQPVQQTIQVRLILNPMEFYALRASSDGVELEIIADPTAESEGQNQVYNTIVIDPYKMTSGDLRLPETVSIVFKGNQIYTTSEVSYKLYNEKSNSPAISINNVRYDQEGHTLPYTYTTNRLLLKLVMYIQGFTEDGIAVNIKFLQRTITDIKLPNNVFDKDGNYVIETKNGSKVYKDGYPVKKTYNAYADYSFEQSDNGRITEGVMPVYYVDPYNADTFALPTSAMFEFAETNPGVYLDYNITGWEYYNGNGYVVLPNQATESERFYREYDENAGFYRCYFHPDENSYKGQYYIIRGYMRVGNKDQYFDVLCVVLNRSLKTGVVLDKEYTVSYDFSDPIAAMLSDIPALLGRNTFVDFDKYNEEFTVSAIKGEAEGVFSFVIGQEGQFSQYVSGVATNFAVLPGILWDDEYDLDGDGTTDITFEELTDKGFDGTIKGRLYYKDNRLCLMFEFYEEKAENDYYKLAQARVWDSLFDANGEAAASYSDTLRIAINDENEELRKDVIYATYKQIVDYVGTTEEEGAYTALSVANKQTLQDGLYNDVLEDIKLRLGISSGGSGTEFDEGSEKNIRMIVNEVFDKVEKAYKSWEKAQGTANSQVIIYRVWNNSITKFKDHDARTSRNISDYQELKAEHFVAVCNRTGAFSSADERTRFIGAVDTIFDGLYIYRNVDIWNDVYAVATAGEKAVMSAYRAKYDYSVENDNISSAYESLNKRIADEDEIGSKGEEATADVTMPVVDFHSMLINGETTSTVYFNKFNFNSVDKEFTVKFEVDYAAVYERMKEDARNNAILSYSEEEKAAIITQYEANATKDSVNAVAPKEKNDDGIGEVIRGMRTNASDPSTGFNYDAWSYWKEYKANVATDPSYYVNNTTAHDTMVLRYANYGSNFGNFWNALLEYRYNDAVKFILNNLNSTYLTSYDEIMSDALQSLAEDEWERIEEAFIYIKAPLMAQDYMGYLENKYNIITDSGKEQAVREMMEYVMTHDLVLAAEESVETRRSNVFAIFGLNGTYNDFTVSGNQWNSVCDIFETRMMIIAGQVMNYYRNKEYKDAEQQPITDRTIRNAYGIKDIAKYVVSEDIKIIDLENIHLDAEKERYIDLAKTILAFGVSNNTLINALKEIGRQEGTVTGNQDLGNAFTLIYSYVDNPEPDRTTFGLLFDLIMSATTDRGEGYLTYSEDTKSALIGAQGSIKEKYTNQLYSFDIDSDEYKAIIIYVALNGGETSNMSGNAISLGADIVSFANFCQEFLVGYMKGRTSPYSILLEDPTSVTNFTKDQIESYNENGSLSENCLLYYTQAEPTYVNMLKIFKTRLGMTDREIELAAKRYTLFNAVRSSVMTVSARDALTKMEDTAKREYRYGAAKRILSNVSEDARSYLTTYLHSGGESMEYKAFVSLVEREEEKGKEKGDIYKDYKEEYIENNFYEFGRYLIDYLQTNYESAIEQVNLSSMTSDSYLAKFIFGDYFETENESVKAYDSITDYDDDYYSASYLEYALEELAKRKNFSLSEVEKERVTDGYLKDALLRAIVYLYEKVADDDRKAIIEEVSEMYTGQTIRDLEYAYIEAAKNGIATGTLGKTIYADLLSRDDMGVNVGKELEQCFYMVWLDNLVSGAEYVVRNYPEEEIITKNPYNERTMITYTTNTFMAASGDNLTYVHSEGDDEVAINARLEDIKKKNDFIKTVTAEAVRREMLKKLFSSIKYDEMREKVINGEVIVKNEHGYFVESVIEDSLYKYAMDYAYDIIYYDASATYREAFTEILEKLVGEDPEVDKKTYENMQQAVLDGRLDVFEDAVEKGVKTVLYTELYDDIKLLSLTPEEFAALAYKFITGIEAENPEIELFGVDKNGTGGAIGRILVEYSNHEDGNVPTASETGIRIQRLKEWWTRLSDTMYGVLGEEEQTFIAQIHSQAYYQVSTNTLLTNAKDYSIETKNDVAYATMITSIYLLLCDIRDYVEENMPKDYLNAENVKEYKAFVIRSLLDSDLMKNEAHSLSLAQATLNSIIIDMANSRAELFYKIYQGSQTTYEYDNAEKGIQLIANYLISTMEAQDGTTQEGQIYEKYITKAIEYVGYTAVAGSQDYVVSEDPLEVNPLYEYRNRVYIAVTGRGKDVTSGNANEIPETQFGMRSFGEILAGAGNNYTNALIALTSPRCVSTTFRSEDFAEEGDKHVVYFDRIEWDEALESGETVLIYYGNKNLFFTNPQKTQKIVDISGGYGYSSSVRATGKGYRFVDFTEVKLYYYGYEEQENALIIDALAPELPDKVYARGMIGTGDENTTYVDLGEVEITEYSNAFRTLVYAGSGVESEDRTIIVNLNGDNIACTKDDAYVVTIEADNGDTYVVTGLHVGYLSRNVIKAYLDPEGDKKVKTYADKSVNASSDIITDSESDYVGMYCIYNESRGTNIMYVNPTDPTLLKSAQRKYILPETMAIECGQGGRLTFKNIVWDTTGVTYGLSGTGAAGVEVSIVSYSYVDDENVTRLIRYDYANRKAYMYVYEDGNLDDDSVEPTEYLLSDMIDWNIVLVVYDKSLTSIDIPFEDTNELLGMVDLNDPRRIVNATGTTSINPYYPEFPEELVLHLGDDAPKITLKQSEWSPSETMLRNIKNGDAESLEFNASFAYYGYTITVRFTAMDIHIMTRAQIEASDGEYYQGGDIYMVRGEGDAKTQFENNYRLMYFNFGDDNLPNWQKVTVALQNYAAIDMGNYAWQRAYGTIGGFEDTNAEFRVKIVNFDTFALINGEDNAYVKYDYYSVPTDNGDGVNISAGNRNGMSGHYVTAGQIFTVIKEDPDFVNSRMKVTVSYDLGEETSPMLAFNENGDRVMQYTFSVSMKTYERSAITNPVFNTDNSAHLIQTTSGYEPLWRWTDLQESNPYYTDAIYWDIGRQMKASDLPCLIDSTTGEEIWLLWDLTDLNVNRANVAVPGKIGEGDGTQVKGYYLTRNNTWIAKTLTIYINKIEYDPVYEKNLSDFESGAVLEFNPENYFISKTYDAQYYVFPFDGIYGALREDGTYEDIESDMFIIEYAKVTEDGDLTWSDEDLPINAGTYYIRINFRQSDYNIYMKQNDEGWSFLLTVSPYQVDMSKLHFEGENSFGAIGKTYGESGTYIVLESGLPKFTPANWFAEGEKETLYNKYLNQGYSDVEAKAQAYSEINNRVTTYMQGVISNWYDEGFAVLMTTSGFANLSDTVRANRIKAWVYENKMSEDLKIEEIGVSYRYTLNGEDIDYEPNDVGNYTIVVTLNDNDNYVTLAGKSEKRLTLLVDKDYDINYSVENTELIYNGEYQNLSVQGLHKNGTVPVGVTVTYEYTVNGEKLVVIVKGEKDENGNVRNVISIGTDDTTLPNPTTGLKDVGDYSCTITISGGKNYIDGIVQNVPFSINPANIFIDIEDIVAIYLKDMVDISEKVRVRDSEGNVLGSGKLLGKDTIRELGVIATSTPVKSYFRTGKYYTYIDGLKASDFDEYVYTEIINTEFDKRRFFDEIYTPLQLITDSNINGYLDPNEETNVGIIKLFSNYNIYIKTQIYYDGQEQGAAGSYRIILEENVGQEDRIFDVSTNEELQELIAGLSDSDRPIIYLSPLYDDEGNLTGYDTVTLNANAEVTIVGYRSNEDASIETWIKNVVMNKGILILKIVAVVGEETGGNCIYLGDEARAVEISQCLITKKDGVENVTGIMTSVNFKASVFVHDSAFEKLSLGIMCVGGELEIEASTFYKNYNGINMTLNHKTSIKTSTFSNNTGTAIRSVAVNSNTTIKDNLFEYNGYALELPVGSTIRLNTNNGNVYVNNGDDVEED